MARARVLDYDRVMSVRVAVVLGMFAVLAALVHGGIYTAGNDFVLNRFTGAYEFVPADDYEDDAALHDVARRFAP